MNKINKKGQGLVTGLVLGVAGLIIGVIVSFVIINTLLTAGLLNAGAENTSAFDMSKNFTAGIDEVSEKIPTILLIAAVVILFGVIVFLVAASKRMGLGGGSNL